MALQNLTREEAIVLLGRIVRGLVTTESSTDYCIWLSSVLEEDAGLNVSLGDDLGFEPSCVSKEEFEKHLFQTNLPSSDSRKRD